MAISRILSVPETFREQDDHLSQSDLSDCPEPQIGPKRFGTATATVMRQYPRVVGPAVLPLFRLAPHGVFRASWIAPRAVSSYLPFSPLPVQRTRRYIFCDTFRHRDLTIAAPAYFTRHAAV